MGQGQGEQERALRRGRRAGAPCLAQGRHQHLLAAVPGELGPEGVVSLRQGMGESRGAQNWHGLGVPLWAGSLFSLTDSHSSAELESPWQDPVRLGLPCEEKRVWSF